MSGASIYDNLQDDEIRLIRLLDNNTTDFEIEIQSFPLIKVPRYTALSYRWGETSRIINVMTNRGILQVTKSLEVFLREVASRKEKAQEKSEWPFGWVWVDAVSINQDDPLERSEQVKKMREIYEHAHNIVIWLGEADSGTPDAFDALEQIATLDTDDPSLTDGLMPGISCRLGKEESYVEFLYETLTYDIGEVLRSPYWDRAWIILEASTPKHSHSDADHKGTTFVCCGGCTIEWDAYAKANNRLLHASWNNELQEHIELHGIANEDIATVKYIQDRRLEGVDKELLYPMLVRCRTSAATDPRDKIYAIAGLTTQRHQKDLQPNYTLRLEEVYVKATKVIIESSQSLDCLGSASLLRDHNVPSWVPDWTVQHSRVPQPFYQYERLWERSGSIAQQNNLFRAGKDVAANIAFANDDLRLIARGFCFDTITDLSVPRFFRGSDMSSEDRWQDWILTAKPNQTTYTSGCTRFEAFEKVIKADFADIWGDWSAERGGSIDDFKDPSTNVFELQDPIVDAMTWNRRLFVTSKGFLGLGPSIAEKSDVLCIVFGSQMPLVLREQDDHWLLVGQAYVHGLMDGAAVDESDPHQWQSFYID